MNTFETVRVTDYWNDWGSVGVDKATSGSKPPADVVQVFAIDAPYDGGPLDFTPEQARTFAAAIVAAANHIDPEGARPQAVRDADGDVWLRTGTDEYTFDGLRESLADVRAAYGPIQEQTP
ncbi:hypothetical protein [Kribbella sp. CA-293567]|uniref:hypothetical protein n=1 Tax=Kribbella sp. CA-293567 TaxID=3002436 RepID=UPI0022DE4EC5|nr:hypothetical protein [Kribbella sp. CA-293567]WBQ03803.1 hypothetical protein OX958_28015 [Kribbella sp. CA-293567]